MSRMGISMLSGVFAAVLVAAGVGRAADLAEPVKPPQLYESYSKNTSKGGGIDQYYVIENMVAGMIMASEGRLERKIDLENLYMGAIPDIGQAALCLDIASQDGQYYASTHLKVNQGSSTATKQPVLSEFAKSLSENYFSKDFLIRAVLKRSCDHFSGANEKTSIIPVSYGKPSKDDDVYFLFVNLERGTPQVWLSRDGAETQRFACRAIHRAKFATSLCKISAGSVPEGDYTLTIHVTVDSQLQYEKSYLFRSGR